LTHGRTGTGRVGNRAAQVAFLNRLRAEIEAELDFGGRGAADTKRAAMAALEAVAMDFSIFLPGSGASLLIRPYTREDDLTSATHHRPWSIVAIVHWTHPFTPAK
jgi:hypothetical protein